jgi:hypothetical protein
MSRLLPDDSPRSIGIAAAMAFEMASTNLVLELSIILIVLSAAKSITGSSRPTPFRRAALQGDASLRKLKQLRQDRVSGVTCFALDLSDGAVRQGRFR